MREWDKNEFESNETESLNHCDLCGSPADGSRRLFKKLGLWVAQCRNCKLIYVNPRLRQSILLQRYSDEYFQNEYVPLHGEYNEQANYNWHAPFLRELDAHAPTRGKLLDIGCAIGLFLAAARLDGWQVLGNELSPFASQYALEKFRIDVIAGKAETLDLPPRSFDAVTLWETIEHVQSPSATIRKAAELVRPGGILALSTPNIDSISYRLLKDKWWIVAPKEHIFYFSQKTLTRLLAQCGFQVKKIWTHGLDLYYLRNTWMGRTVMPLHIRAAQAFAPSNSLPAPSVTLPEKFAITIWPKLKPLARQVLKRTQWADTLYIYAIKRDV